MPMCTYIMPGEDVQQRLNNKGLDKELDNLPKGCLIQEHSHEKGFFKKKTFYLYSLLWKIGDSCEYQIINFPPKEDNDRSINGWVPARVMLSFLMGLRIGKDEEKKKHE